MADRIPCLNPSCRCTAPSDRHPGSSSIICRKCWRAMPNEFRARWKQLNARSRRLTRVSRKVSFNRPERQVNWIRISEMYDRSWQALEIAIKHHFRTGETPIGIEKFLKEIGLV